MNERANIFTLNEQDMQNMSFMKCAFFVLFLESRYFRSSFGYSHYCWKFNFCSFLSTDHSLHSVVLVSQCSTLVLRFRRICCKTCLRKIFQEEAKVTWTNTYILLASKLVFGFTVSQSSLVAKSNRRNNLHWQWMLDNCTSYSLFITELFCLDDGGGNLLGHCCCKGYLVFFVTKHCYHKSYGTESFILRIKLFSTLFFT